MEKIIHTAVELLKSMMSLDKPDTLIDVLKQRAAHSPEQLAYTFLSETKKETLTYKELLHEVMRIASHLLQVTQPGARALLLLPPGLDYIATFLGCLMAGVVAVPAYPPRGNRHAQRIDSIIHDAKATVVLTTSLVAQDYSFAQVHLIAIDAESFEECCAEGSYPLVSSEDLAFLQYTSGSTGSPKGVMVSHGNILANTAMINTLFLGKGTTLCSWLPPFHDMGLIGAILYPLAYGVHSVLMAPVTFMRKPFFWLKTISDYQANVSPAPNFSYEMCAHSITEEEKKQLDLRHWLIALNGAEPVKAKTLAQFSSAFKKCGFQAEFCYPAYGMAETTLIVCAKKPESTTKILDVDKVALQEFHQIKPAQSEHETLSLVGCGYTTADHDLKIIDPQTHQPLKPLEIGEIVVAGPTVAQGYWDKPDLTAEVFGLMLSGTAKKYLHTGDLGFVDEHGELFVTGRLKDLIIIHGRNLYPQDIEASVHDCHPSLIHHGCAAFTLDIEDKPELVIVQEVHRRAKDYEEIFNAIFQRCAEDGHLLPARIILIQQATLPKTSSGKVQRSACRQAVINEELKVVAQWQKLSANTINPTNSAYSDELGQWMQQWFAERFRLQPTDINTQANFACYGVDSCLAMQFCEDLGKVVQKEINPSLLWTYFSIEQLADYLRNNEKGNKDSVQTTSQHAAVEPIAIIGMSCRFPGQANTPEAFWDLLRSGRDAIQEVPAARWDNELYYHGQAVVPGKIITSKGGFIEHVDAFDANLFGISRREAEAMDPQHRLLLELAWEALEKAGIAPLSLDNSDTGIFIGIASNDYSQIAHSAANVDAYYGIGNAHSAAAGRVAYFLGTHGEAMAVDTACSSSLVAVFNACQDLHENSCSLAIVGGVNIILDPALSISFSQAGMLSPQGKCQVFDAKADGYVRSEGGGVLILKRLADAQRDHDPILAVIDSAMVNSDGHSNGITAPSPKAQRDLIFNALHLAGLSADDIDYVEAHGTGTRLGDPIEFSALKEVFATGTRRKELCIGSVKSNIGHLEAAAGMAGLIKTILMLQHQQIPPNLHFDTINPLIDLASLPAQVPTALQQWDSVSIRRAGISSFGFTGTNAHLILAEYPQQKAARDATSNLCQRPVQIFTLSGHTPEALVAQRAKLLAFLQQEESIDIARLCHSLATGRSALTYRMAFPVQTGEELMAQLKSPMDAGKPVGTKANKIVFLFTGQGSHYSGMGRVLYQDHPVFKEHVDHCCELLAEYLPESLLPVMFHPEKAFLLEQTQYMQPALFVLQYALAKLWLSWGVQPAALIGHSVGEYVAATVAGVMSLSDGLKLIAHRARLMQAQKTGGMLAVNIDANRAKILLNEFKKHHVHAILNIAAVNGHNQIVFAGAHEAIRQFSLQCDRLQLRTTRLSVSHAFHSELMRPMLAEFQQIAATITYHKPNTVLISNINGQELSHIDANYWCEHVLATVQFAAGIQKLIQLDYQIFIEMGPQPVLLSFAQGEHKEPHKVRWLPSLRKNQSNWQTLSEAVAALYQDGVPINWHAYDAPFEIQSYIKPLPTYCFQRQSYWLPTELVQNKDETALNTLVNKALYQIEWKPVGAATCRENTGPLAGKWLLFINQDADSMNTAAHLSTCFSEVICVYPGTVYQGTSDLMTLNPYEPEHFLRLLSEHAEIHGVIYLWGTVARAFYQKEQLHTINDEDFKQLITGSCAGLFHLVQAIVQQKSSLRLWTITRASTSLHPDSIPLFAPLVGMGKTLVLEHPELRYQHLDVAIDTTDSELAQQCYYLLQPQQFNEPLLAYRQHDFYAPRLISAAATSTLVQKKALHQHATYVITGGLGGIGSLLCQWLLQNQVNSILILGRRPLTPELEQQIQAFATDQTAVRYVQADVSDYQQVHHALMAVQQNNMPAIKGVFHAAGILNDGLWLNLRWHEFEKVLQAKVQGAWNLHRLSLELMPELEQFVLFSSIGALFGSPGQANYTAANAFLDNLAHYRIWEGLPALSINFGPWQQIGMTRDLHQTWLAYGIDNINEKLGLSALKRIMSFTHPQWCLMPNNMNAVASGLPAPYKLLLAELIRSPEMAQNTQQVVVNKLEQDWLTTLKQADAPQRVTMLTELLINTLRAILRLKEYESLPMSATLVSLGIDSILAAELLRQLQLKLALDNLSIQALLFENRSLHELVHLLDDRVMQGHDREGEILSQPINDFARVLQLSVQQTRIWRHIQEQPANPAYLVTQFFTLDGAVDPSILERSIQQVVERHPMLRCSFHTSLGVPFQFCHDQVHFKLHYEDLSRLSTYERELHITHLLQHIAEEPFDLATAPLIRSALLRCGEQHAVWALSVSHLLTDGASNLILFHEVLHQYAANQHRTTEQLAPATPYQDFIYWQLGSLINGTYERYEEFWRERLHHYSPPVLPTDKPAPAQALSVGAKESLPFTNELFNDLQILARNTQVTLPNLLLAAYGVLLAQFAEEEHAFITMLCGGRESGHYQNTIGNVANELPLVIPCAATMTFLDVAQQVQNNLAETFAYQYMQPEQIAELGLPIPDVSFDFQHHELKSVDPGFKMSSIAMESKNVPLWGPNPRKISLKLIYDGTLLKGHLKYRTDLYDRKTICHLTAQFLTILREVSVKPESTCGNLADLLGATL